MTVWQIVLVVYVLGAVVATATHRKVPNEDYVDHTVYGLVWFVYVQMIAAGMLMLFAQKLRRREPSWTLEHEEDGSARIVPGPKVDDE